MEINELQNGIIRKVLHTDDHPLLNYMYQFLDYNCKEEPNQLSDSEKSNGIESKNDDLFGETIPNEILFYQNNKWMSE